MRVRLVCLLILFYAVTSLPLSLVNSLSLILPIVGEEDQPQVEAGPPQVRDLVCA